jgi:hypothetical protein
MKRSDAPEPEFLIGGTAITGFFNGVLKPAKLTRHQLYRLLENWQLRAGKLGAQFPASPTATREHLTKLASGGDSLAGGGIANGLAVDDNSRSGARN